MTSSGEDDGHDAYGRPTKRSRHTPINPEAMYYPEAISNISRVGADYEHSQPESSNLKSWRPDSIGVVSSSTRGRGEEKDKTRKLSCKECRRLKLKCDRIFPCKSCVKRGCGSLCPEGALTSGRGSRFILANTEQLHEKIIELSDRVRQLEDGLETLQSTYTNEPHPLLAPELLRIKTSQELYGIPTSTSQAQPTQSTMTPPREELPPTTTGLSLFAGGIETIDSIPPDVPPDILQLSATFPFPWQVDLRIRQRIRDALPPRAEAEIICEESRRNALWQYNLDASETFIPNLLHYCYTTPTENLSPRRLALLLMVLSIGSLVDLNRPLGSLHGEAYHHLARAAVCEIPLMEEPDFDVLHALFFMIWYHLIFSDNKKAVGYAWNLMGFVAKLAQGLGLHRDGSRLKMIPEEHERRRAVFWELLNLDCRMSLSLGRPPSICLAHVDTEPPSHVGPGLFVPKEEISYHQWKHTFFRECLTPMLEAMVSVKPPDYSYILYLDKVIRDFSIPSSLLEQNDIGTIPRFLVMQRGLVSMGREIALLQMHRRYFTEAISGTKECNLDHRYAPSLIATYLGASSLIGAVESLYNQEQQLSVRFLHFWFNAFSAAVTLSLLISRAPSTALARCALQDLEKVVQLFSRAAVILPFCGKALPIISKLAERCRRILLQCLPPNTIDYGGQVYSGYVQQMPLPPSFSDVHPFISQFAKQISRSFSSLKTSNYGGLGSSNYGEKLLPELEAADWLPGIYHFNTMGLNLEDRYNSFARPQPTPFVPSSPRIAENQRFNFEYGALTADVVEETSFMVWF